MLSHRRITHLRALEAEAIHIIREVAAEFDNPVLLYSVGKDSSCLLRLCMKAFWPAPLPFPLLHIDTTYNFRDMITFRDHFCAQHNLQLYVHINEQALAEGLNPFNHGSQRWTDAMLTQSVKAGLARWGFDAAFGGARRDEEKSRAKERIYSFRDRFQQWDPRNQRPELWNLYNGRKVKGESFRVFPISNWTELDIWQYIWLEDIPIVPLYFSAPRPVVEREGTLIVVDDDRMGTRLLPGEEPTLRSVRFRTLGDYPLSGAIESEATTIPAIIEEMLRARTSERQGRLVDFDEEASMEQKKRDGYF
jgi:sulfate adenylyltransferase subunit 2